MDIKHCRDIFVIFITQQRLVFLSKDPWNRDEHGRIFFLPGNIAKILFFFLFSFFIHPSVRVVLLPLPICFTAHPHLHKLTLARFSLFFLSFSLSLLQLSSPFPIPSSLAASGRWLCASGQEDAENRRRFYLNLVQRESRTNWNEKLIGLSSAGDCTGSLPFLSLRMLTVHAS